MMGTRIYVGNLSTRVTETDLEDEVRLTEPTLFECVCAVQEIRMRA